MTTARKTAAQVAVSTGSGYKKIKIRRVYEEVCDQVRLQLTSGQLKAGDKLPSERTLAVDFGVSRVVVREALRTLEMSGIVELRLGVKGGAYVRDGSAQMLTKSFEDLVVLGRISMRHLADARRMIHGAVLQSACEHGSARNFNAIEANLRLLDRLAAEEDWLGRAEAAVQFFHLLAEATHNEVMVILVDSLSELLRYVVREKASLRFRPELVPIRWKILEYLRARDTPRAVACMDEYLKIVHVKVPAVPASSRT
jgi:GntR family transcriptional repressor for pyruvate dehydrogenase complex